MQLPRDAFLGSDKGGSIRFIRDGEILASIWVPPGLVPVAQYLDVLPDGAEVDFGGELALLTKRGLTGAADFGKAHFTSAVNPDYEPSAVDRFEREMRLMVSQLAAKTERLEARERAVAQIERIPQNADAGAVLEPAEAAVAPVEAVAVKAEAARGQ